ncbi:MAG: GNAT family N-acetyltransferase [Proteobacteria bacterium]|nr:GNAT family N-acetyltransferase [Pseudomonadota bacterium]
MDEKNRVGEVEPMATHPSFQRRGFATAMITECF